MNRPFIISNKSNTDSGVILHKELAVVITNVITLMSGFIKEVRLRND